MADDQRLVVGSVGTDHHPFPRFLDWMAAARHELGVDVFVQRGATPEHPDVPGVDYLPAGELEARMAAADAVVCHGGPGTMSLAQRCGHRPIVIARDPALGEHVDDHQQRYTAQLQSEGLIDTPHSVAELVELIRTARRHESTDEHSAEIARAAARFGELVDALLAGTLPRRRWRERMLFRRTP
ncbi:MAG: glycosyl transferase family 28 [Actinobacteria bacterium]|nr:glycosyl transferase family 28 [Actinomycetota bacterium]